MILYIRIEDGQTVDHPVVDWNLMDVYGKIPANYEPFERTQMPPVGPYEFEDPDAPLYIKVNGVWTDAWARRPMTDDERAEVDAARMVDLVRIKAHIIGIWEEHLADAQNDDERKVCEDYIAQLDAIPLSLEEGFLFPDPPMPPHVRRMLPPRLPTDGPGNAPEVIG
jgi:hypothetical protein